MKQITYRKRAIIHGLSMAVFLGACLGAKADDQNDDKGVSAQTTVKSDRADRTFTTDSDRAANNGKLSHGDASFVREAAKGGLMEVRMGQSAKDHASSADVKNYGERLVKDHTKANDKLSQLASQKGINLAKDVEPEHTSMLKDWEGKSGADFDKAFIQYALKDHKKDIEKFEKASRDLSNSELRSFAMDTLPTLREHYDEAQRIARSLGMDVTAADTSDYHRNDITVSPSPAAGSPGVSIESQNSSVNRIDSAVNSGGKTDLDIQRKQEPMGGYSSSVDTGAGSADVNINTDHSASSSDTTSSYSSNSTASTPHKRFLGMSMEKNDGRTLWFNTRKDDGKLLGIFPAPSHKKAENRVDVDMNPGARDTDVSVGAPGSSESGTASADVKVDHDKGATKLSYSDLPQKVQDAIKAEGGTADVKTIKKHTVDGKTVYKVSIRKEGRDRVMKFNEDGTIIKDNNK